MSKRNRPSLLSDDDVKRIRQIKLDQSREALHGSTISEYIKMVREPLPKKEKLPKDEIIRDTAREINNRRS